MSNDLASVSQIKAAGGMAEIASSRQAQEVQAAVVMARRFPRDTTQAITRIVEDCKRKGLAERAVYSYPRGGQLVSGPSIRLAETMIRAWGNADCGIVELERRAPVGNLPGESIMQAFCWDMETNTRVTKTFTVAHKRDSKKGSSNLTDERDIYEAVANYGARRLRACILAIIPVDVIEQAVEQCEKTMAGGSGPLIDRVRDVVLKFKEIGVTQEMLEKRLGHKIDVTTESELVQLKKIGLSIQDGFSKREDFFELSSEPAQEQAAEPAQKKTVKTIKNFAPQTSEEAKDWKPGDYKEEVREAPATTAPDRDELSKLINKERVRVGLQPAKLNAMITKMFKKQPAQMSMDELMRLFETLCGMENEER